MGFQLANDLRQAVEATARKMNVEHLDMCAIPDTPGMTLYRRGSKEYTERNPSMPIPVVIEGSIFLVGVDREPQQPSAGSPVA